MTPQERAAAMVSEPAWGFASNPSRAISHASVRAAQAVREGRESDARYWTSVGLALNEAAGIEPGQVLQNIRDRQ